jgi:hypothetical protein
MTRYVAPMETGMNVTILRPIGILVWTAASCVMAYAVCASAQESVDVEPVVVVREGPSAAFEFEKSFRDPDRRHDSKPVDLQQCENITKLNTDFWSKKHVLTDFKKRRTMDQVGVIVIIKTELCCRGSRLCAVTTACLEKKSTPLVGRFLVYAGWVKNDPDFPDDERREWDAKLIDEYDFIQGPGARVAVMVPTWDGKMYQWYSTATKLELVRSTFETNQGETPKLEQFLQTALDYAPPAIPEAVKNRLGLMPVRGLAGSVP